MRTLIRAALQTLFSSMAVQVLTAIAGIFVARRLGPTGRGELAAVLLWSPVFYTVIHLGFGQAIQFYYAQLPEHERQSLFGNIVLMASGCGVTGALLAWWLLPALLRSQPAHVVTLARIYTLHLPLGMFAEYASSLLLGSKRFGRVNILRVLTPLSYLLGLACLVLANRLTLVPIFVVHVLCGHVGIVYALFQLKRAGALTFRPDLGVLKRCLSYGLRTHLGTLCSLTSGQGDRMLMAAFLPSRDLGLYSVAVSTSMLPYAVVQAITTTLLPAVVAETAAERRDLSLRIVRLTIPLLVLIYGGLFFVAQPLVVWLYGAAYGESVFAARLLMLGTVAFGAADVLRQAIRALGKPVLSSMGDVAGLVATIGLLAFLLPRFGFLGAAYASLGAYTVTYAVLVFSVVTGGATRPAEVLLLNRNDIAVVREAWAGAVRWRL